MIPASPAEEIRRELDVVLAGALEAVNPEILVRDALLRQVPLASDGDRAGRGEDVLLAAVGKASVPMARGAHSVLGSRVRDGVIVTPRVDEPVQPGTRDPGLARLRIFYGGHPLPDVDTVEGAQAVLALVREARPGDRIVLLLSGGASALLTLPTPDVTLEDLATTTGLLMEAGADIVELNTVRKHLDRLKGGGLAREAAPTPVWAGILSDVVGDRLDVIGSGPVSPDPSTFSDALDVVTSMIPDGVPPRVLRHLRRGSRGELVETPGEGAPCFEGVETMIVGNAETAVGGAAETARKRGYVIRRGSCSVTGEARLVGRDLGIRARSLAEEVARTGRPTCFVSAGEATVTVTGSGRGGPNQEVTLAAALELARWAPGRSPHGPTIPEEGAGSAESAPVELIVASVGTDGVDGPTDAAGAVADPRTVARAREAGLSPEGALLENDSHEFFRSLDDLVVSGPTGTNVMDLHLVLARPAPSGSGG